MDPKTKAEARLAMADANHKALQAEVRAVCDLDPSAAKDSVALRKEATRLRTLLPTLPD
jgi:DNA primase